jgi:sugar phosphate isomerase/epimerase
VVFNDIRARCAAAGIALTAYNISFRDDFTDEEIVRGFEMARALGVDVITASSNVTTSRRLDPIARRFGIRVGFHNHSAERPNEFRSPDDFRRALEGTSDLMAINLDIGHFTAANFDPVAFLDEHHDRIVSIHVKDRKRDDGANVAFGTGDTAIRDVLLRLRDRGWAIPANVEYEYDGKDTIAEVRRCLEYCREVLDGSQSRGWQMLFDGTSMQAWRGYKSDALPAGWGVADGVLSKDGAVPDIISREQFGDFELELDWRIGEAGNSGVFYRGTEEYDRIYWSAPEYQLLDDQKAADNKTRLTCAGASYALYSSPAGHLKPVGEWNQTRIVARGAHVEHWLNGVKVLEFEQGSADWNAKVAASKFKDWPNFGKSMRGHLAIQGDHAGALAFRNIRIRPA